MSRHEDGDGQLALSVPAASPARARDGVGLAAVDPIARVQVETGLAHLDRPFEYLVPEQFAETAGPGARVRVRFAGQDTAGFVLERVAEPEHQGRLAPLRRVVSPEPVLTPALLALVQAVAQRYAGTVEDVLRLAVPPRHARAEQALAEQAQPDPVGPPAELGGWTGYPAGPALLRRLAAGEAVTAAWTCTPGAAGVDAAADPRDWAGCLATAAQQTLAAGRGVLLVVPDGTDVHRVDQALTARLGRGQHVTLTADQGAQARYTAWLKVLRGHARCVVGTRAAAFAPVRDLGLVACWDDGDDAYVEPRAPYPHTREILRLAAQQAGAALIVGGLTRSVPVQSWVERGELQPVEPAERERAAPTVRVAGEEHDLERHGPAARAHLPSMAWQVAKRALEQGPVLVQVPRRGYLPALACRTCRAPKRCSACQGPLGLLSGEPRPSCRWCGQRARDLRCPVCDDDQLRSVVVGSARTAEELGRAFPGMPVLRSGGEQTRPVVGTEPALVVSTPGAEPTAPGGYAATLLLDAWALLDRPTLDASAEAYRRWSAAAALTRSRADNGVVVLCGAPSHATLPAVEALVRWAPGWFAERELADRRELAQPPSAWLAMLTGARPAIEDFLTHLTLPSEAQVLGPLAAPGRRPGESDAAQALVRAPAAAAAQVTRALHAARAVRSARKSTGSVQVRVDPDPSLL